MAPLFLLAFASGAGLGYCYYRGVCSRSHKREIKEHLTRWEGEGGNVPEVVTPTPLPHQRPSRTIGMEDVRH